MSLYSFLALGALGIVFLGVGLDWLGWAFLIIAIISLTYKREKSFMKKAWAQALAAEGSYPAGKMKAYTKEAAKQFAETTSTWETTKYNIAATPHKLSGASKKTLDELNDLFK
jgi:hypothetical protein